MGRRHRHVLLYPPGARRRRRSRLRLGGNWKVGLFLLFLLLSGFLAPFVAGATQDPPSTDPDYDTMDNGNNNNNNGNNNNNNGLMGALEGLQAGFFGTGDPDLELCRTPLRKSAKTELVWEAVKALVPRARAERITKIIPSGTGRYGFPSNLEVLGPAGNKIADISVTRILGAVAKCAAVKAGRQARRMAEKAAQRAKADAPTTCGTDPDKGGDKERLMELAAAGIQNYAFNNSFWTGVGVTAGIVALAVVAAWVLWTYFRRSRSGGGKPLTEDAAATRLPPSILAGWAALRRRRGGDETSSKGNLEDAEANLADQHPAKTSAAPPSPLSSSPAIPQPSGASADPNIKPKEVVEASERPPHSSTPLATATAPPPPLSPVRGSVVAPPAFDSQLPPAAGWAAVGVPLCEAWAQYEAAAWAAVASHPPGMIAQTGTPAAVDHPAWVRLPAETASDTLKGGLGESETAAVENTTRPLLDGRCRTPPVCPPPPPARFLIKNEVKREPAE